MKNPEKPENKFESATEVPEALPTELVRKLAKVIGKYGEAGGTLGKNGFRLNLSAGEKSIYAISVLGPNDLILALSLSGDIPSEGETHTFRSDSEDGRSILIKWDRRISLRDVEIAMAMFDDASKGIN